MNIEMLGKKLLQFVMFISLLMMFKVTFAATAYVDRNNIALNETFTLVIGVENISFSGKPDLSPLEKDFTLLGTSQSSSMNIINGKTSKKTEWTTMLAPKKEGTFLIPSLQVGKDTTNPLTIIVTKAPISNASNKSDIFIETEIDKTQAYVQQQLMYTIRIFTSIDFSARRFSHVGSEDYKDDRVTVVKAEDDKRFGANIGGKRYEVIEQKYLIFPQQADKITLPAPKLLAAIGGRRDVFGFNSFRNKRQKQISVSGESVDIDVKPIPQNFSSNWWLPAKDVALSQQWSADLNKLKVGEPLTRTITLMAKGANAEQLPDLQLPTLSDAKIYPDKVERTSGFNGEDVIGKSVNKLLIIPGKAGEMIIPETKVIWWDVEQNQQREAVLPAQTLMVKAAELSPENANKKLAQQQVINTAKDAEQTNSQANDIKQDIPQQSIIDTETKEDDNHGRWYIELPLLILILLVVIGWIIDHLRLKRIINQSETNEESTGQKAEQEKKLRKQLKQVCSGRDPKQVRQSLLEWGKLVVTDKSPVTLLDIAQYYNDQNLLNEINRLENVIYGEGESTWSGANLWNAIEKAIHNNDDTSNSINNKLEQLHRV